MKKGATMSAAEKARRAEAAKRQWTPEARAAASQRAKARVGKSPSSASAPSSGSATSSLPPTLPPVATTSGPQGSGEALLESLLERLKGTVTTETETTSNALPELPDDDAEREAALRPARWPARIPVVAFDETFQLLGLESLSQQERDEGLNAFAVLFWQWGLFRDGRVLVALWLFGVATPRATAAFLAWRMAKRTPMEKLEAETAAANTVSQ